MAGNKEYNSDLQIKGKINLKDVPNNTPTGYLVWNSQIKDIAQRSPAQTIVDLNLITATNIASLYYNKTQVNTNINTAIDAIQIGGRNLAKNSKGFIDSNSYYIRNFSLSENLVSGEKYVITLETKVPNQNANAFFLVGDLLGNQVAIIVKISPTKFQVAFTYLGASINELVLFRYPNDNSYYQFLSIKVEKGTKATDWTPAPEDQVSDWNTTDVNDFSVIKNLPNHIRNIGSNDINNWNNKINAAENATIVGFSNGNANDPPYIRHNTAGYVFLATQTWVNSQGYLTAANTSLTYSGTTLNLTVAGVTKSTSINAIPVGDGIDRNPNNIIATDNPKRVRFDFVSAGTVGGSGNFAGVMSISPWDGLTASTGDSAYQLAFCNETGVNGAGLPGLKLRKGIDSTWGSWYDILHGGNGVTLNTAQTITGLKTFNNPITAPSFLEGSLRSLKTNIETFEKSGIDLVNELEILTFDRKDKSAVNKIGIIADDSPEEFLSESKSEVDLYKTIFVQAKAIQELTARLEELEKKLI